MDLTQRIRNCLVIAVLPALIGLTAFVAPASAGGGPLLPDLKTVRTGDETSDWLEIREHGKNKFALRIGNTIGNLGAGPLELVSGPATPACEAQGQYDGGEDLEAVQNVYEDDGDGVFERNDDVPEPQLVSCFEFHPKHDHWHLQDFSQFALTDLEGDPVPGVAPSQKIGFCLTDFGGVPFPGLPGTPSSPYYNGNCGQGNPSTGPEEMGISVGYGDLYTKETPGQRLNVTGIGGGNYCLASTANPDYAGDPLQLMEATAGNNARRRELRINPERGIVKDLGKCPA
jgi:hypothetical protein